MKLLFAFILIFFTLPSQAKMVKVAVIDTGFDFKSKWAGIETQKTYDGKSLKVPKMCKTGHKDFTNTSIEDTHGHGTHVSGIIATYAGDSEYCLIMIKYYTNKSNGMVTLANSIKSIKYAIDQKVDIISYSGGGINLNIKEYYLIQKALNKGIVVVAAAGNEGRTINHTIHKVIKLSNLEGDVRLTYTDNKTLDFEDGYRVGYYPANYDKRIFSVVNVGRNGKTVPTSNRGSAFTHGAMGVNVKSIMPGNSIGLMTGTSQAVPKITAKIIKGLQDTK